MKESIKTKELKEFIKILKKNDFKVYAPKKITTYCHFVKNNNIGYVERTDSGFNFSSVHKPNNRCGTGYGIFREEYSPTISHAERCFIYKPNWASVNDIVEKYKSWDDYISNSINQIIKYYEVK